MATSKSPSSESLYENQSFFHRDLDLSHIEATNSRFLNGKARRLNHTTITILASIILSLASVFLIISHLFGTNTMITTFDRSGVAQASEGIMRAPCGSTPAEARAAGCNFDIISFCWLPDRCYDRQLSESFDDMRTWEWFRDPNRTQPVSHEQALTGEFDGLFVNWEYHLRHCTAMWEKMHRAVLGEGKLAIDSYIGPLNHTRHCSHMLLSDRDVAFDIINTIILVKYPDCGID